MSAPWLRKLFRPPTPIRKRPRPRLRLERLEDRTVPTIWTVTTLADSGTGSLRAAVQGAADGDVINFSPSLDGHAIDLTTGTLVVEHSISIAGPGANQLTVERSYVQNTPAFRIFAILPENNVSISGLTIQNGLVDTDQNGYPVVSTALGGGIYNASGANLTVTGSMVTGNGAYSVNQTNQIDSLAEGGGIYNAGTATVSLTTLSYNSAGGSWATYAQPGGGAAAGAGIYNAGTLTLSGCVVSNNTIASSAGVDPITGQSTYTGDSHGEGFGGAVYTAYGTNLSISSAVLIDNQAFGYSKVLLSGPWGGGISGGGALYVAGSATVTDTDMDSNYANFDTRTFTYGSGVGGGVFIDPTGNAVFNRVTVSNCEAASDKPRGGGLFIQGTLVGTNVTVSGNLANWNPIPPSHGHDTYGGGIAVWDSGQLTLQFSTVVYNTALTYDPNGHPEQQVSQGGGLYVGPDASATVDSDILALNQAGASSGAFGDPEQPLQPGQDVFGTVSSNGHNLIGKVEGSSGWLPSDQWGTMPYPLDPKLGPLQDNGGPVIGYPDPGYSDPNSGSAARRIDTHEVQAGSRALQAGNPATAPATDARGVHRDQTQPNIGAYEATLSGFQIQEVGTGTIYVNTPFSITVTAVDPYGKTVYVYVGTIHFSSSDPGASLPTDYTFTPNDEGSHMFSGVQFSLTGLQSITVNDVADPSKRGTTSFDVYDDGGGGGGGGGPPAP
jgi:hypothetical protein